jgi:hypothetical protein
VLFHFLSVDKPGFIRYTTIVKGKVYLIEFNKDSFYRYKGLYVMIEYDAVSFSNELYTMYHRLAPIANKPIPETGIHVDLRLSFLDIIRDHGIWRLIINDTLRDLFTRLRETGLYPVKLIIETESKPKPARIRTIIDVLENSTLTNVSKLIDTITEIVNKRYGPVVNNTILIKRLPIRDPRIYAIFGYNEAYDMLKRESYLRNLIVGKMIELYKQCNAASVTINATKTYCRPYYDAIAESVFISDSMWMDMDQICISNIIPLYIGGNADTIWEIVYNETRAKVINSILDRITEALKELGGGS